MNYWRPRSTILTKLQSLLNFRANASFTYKSNCFAYTSPTHRNSTKYNRVKAAEIHKTTNSKLASLGEQIFQRRLFLGRPIKREARVMAEGGLSGPRAGAAGILRHGAAAAAAAVVVAVVVSIIAISVSSRRVSTGSHRRHRRNLQLD